MLLLRCPLFFGIHRPDCLYVGIREAGYCGDVAPGMDLPPVTFKIFNDVATVAKVKHDVAKIACMLKPKRVPQFVEAGQINNAIAQ